MVLLTNDCMNQSAYSYEIGMMAQVAGQPNLDNLVWHIHVIIHDTPNKLHQTLTAWLVGTTVLEVSLWRFSIQLPEVLCRRILQIKEVVILRRPLVHRVLTFWWNYELFMTLHLYSILNNIIYSGTCIKRPSSFCLRLFINMMILPLY